MKRLLQNLALVMILSACVAPEQPVTIPASLAAPSPGASPASATLASAPSVTATVLPTAVPAQPAPVTPEPLSQKGKLAFVRGGSIWTVDLPDGSPQRLTEGSNDTEPEWSASGRWLAYRGNGSLSVVHDDGSQDHSVNNSCSYPQGIRLWAPTADEILCFTAGGGLAIVQADGSGRRELVPPANGRRGDGISSAVWNPDGKTLAYARTDTLQTGQPAGQVASLRRIGADGTGDRELVNAGTPSVDGLVAAAWSPDGARILYRVVPYFSGSFWPTAPPSGPSRPTVGRRSS
jgi:hypothetical protein